MPAVVKDTPVLAGVCGTDPFRVMDVFLKELKDMGFSGVQNFPTVGLIDGVFRQNLEETDMGYDLEVEMIRKAHELDLLTTPYVFDPDQARKMAEARGCLHLLDQIPDRILRDMVLQTLLSRIKIDIVAWQTQAPPFFLL